MPNQLDQNGLTIKTRAEILADILDGSASVPGLRSIYGADINVDPNTPDGNMANIFAQAAADALELLAEIFSSFDPDQAVGTALDQRCATNGVIRKVGTHTQQAIVVTVSQAVTLPGQDTDSPFTVADSAGTQYQLVASHVFSGSGSATLTFAAVDFGPVESGANTIKTVVTVTIGVTSVNNPSAPTTLGTNEETDASLRIRRALSVGMPARGYIDGMIAALLALDGVTAAKVYENHTNTGPDANGVAAHSIWVLVAGGDQDEIAATIARYRSAGCGMKGSTTRVVILTNTSIYISFDRPTPENLYITFNATAITGSVDEAYIRAQLTALLSYTIGQSADVTTIEALVKQISPNVYVDTVGVSAADSGYTNILAPTGVNYQFTVHQIKINGNT